MEQHPAYTDSCIAIVGMNGVGKSQFGKTLASKLKMKRIDTDTEFRKLHGKEETFIEQHGWDAFRKAEEQIILRSILPNHVVILGGGGVETPAVRSALKDKALVLWMQAGHKRVQKHLKHAKLARPEFKAGITAESVKQILQKRNPLYEDIATITLPGHLRFSERVPKAIELLEKAVTERPGSPSQ